MSHFDNARKKYGLESFTYEVLETVTESNEVLLHSKLDALEEHYIALYDSYNNGYNSTTGGSSGWVASNETRKIMSESAKERFKDPKNHPRYGTSHTEESKRRISESKKGKLTGGDNPFSKSVLCYTKDGKFVKEFSSIAEANTFVNKPVSMTGINKCCKGITKSAYGYVWKYKN